VAPYTIHPLFLDGAAPGAPLLLTHQAIEKSLLEVVERDEGVVQELFAWNRGDAPVAILEGDTLVGCKQNRVVARSVILGGGAKLPIPVGCMEQGRWAWRTRSFGSGATRVSPTLRSATSDEIRAAKKARAARVTLDQSRLWNEVACSLGEESVASRSSDYHAFIDAKLPDTRQRMEALRTRPGQVGVLLEAEGVFLGLELAGHPDVWAALAPRTLPGYLMDARWAGDRAGGAAKSDAHVWLEKLKRAPLDVAPGLGLGDEVDVEDAALGGSGLWFGGAVVHMAVFRKV